MSDINAHEVIDAWKPFIDSIEDWEELVSGVEPKQTGCGPVYELPNPIEGRPNESFAIADMRNLPFSEPHYHANGEFEIYVGITGLGRMVVGGAESDFGPGVVSITPPDTVHFVVPSENLVLAVINTPPFNPANAVSVTESDSAVGFDAEQLARLTAQAAAPQG